MHDDVAYFFAVVFHLLSFFAGFYVIYKNEDIFKNSRPCSVLVSRVEFHFWTVIISVVVNSVWILLILPRWMGDKPIISNNLAYAISHCGTAFVLFMFHINSLRELRGKLRG